MASRKIEDLVPEVQEKAKTVVEKCRSAGVDLLIYCTLRGLDEQAILYRQSRTRSEIISKMDKLRQRGYGFLADIIDSVGPQSGPHVTNAAPGESWHNYAEAWDAVPLINGKAMWSYDENKQLWQVYGNAVAEAGLDWAGNWTGFVEHPHAQLRKGGNPLTLHEPDEIKEILISNGLL